MRIALLSDATMPTPTPGRHGLGRIASVVAEGLLSRGHDVVLFCKVGSAFSGAMVMSVNADGYEGEKIIARDALKLHKEFMFDVFLDMGHLHYLSRTIPTLPVVNVYHDIYQPYSRCAVLLSEGQRVLLPSEFENACVIPNALSSQDYMPRLEYGEDDYVLFVGALSDIKQPILAIEACARMGVKLKMAGQQLTGKMPFTNNESVEYVGVVSGSAKDALFQNARVFLQLGIGESYGLTTVEAGLYGTPVVGWPSGGTLDLIRYGVNGVFVPAQGSDKVGNVVDAMERAWFIPRRMCRAYAETLCNPDGQIDAYETVLGDCTRGRVW